MRAAAIGIGSNSLRMLIADIKDAQLYRVLRDREGLRVFAALDPEGNIATDMMERACQSVLAMAKKATEYEVDAIHLFATSAVRDANNQREFSLRLMETTGLALDICTGSLEAKLSFIGATESARSGMIDIGGGSTEIVVGKEDQIEFADSLQMGAVRLYRMKGIDTVSDAYEVVKLAGTILQPQKAGITCLQPPSEWVGVGGTFTTTAALVQQIPWSDRKRIHGFMASREHIRHCMERLAGMTLEQRMNLQELQPQRADIITHGLAILLCCMDELNIVEIKVSEHGNLEGYLKMQYLS